MDRSRAAWAKSGRTVEFVRCLGEGRALHAGLGCVQWEGARLFLLLLTTCILQSI
jgi:hypothetical protein